LPEVCISFSHHVFVSSCFCQGIVLSFEVAISSSGPSEDNPLVDTINPYMRELKMHPKELLLKVGSCKSKMSKALREKGVSKPGWKH
jgi:hypothetical protein